MDLWTEFFDQLGRMPAARRRRHPEGVPGLLKTELLEDRSLLSPFYDLSTVASTLDGTFSSFGDLVSTNNSGDIAFVGHTRTSDFDPESSGLWVASNAGGLTNINPKFSSTPERDFGRAAEINSNDLVVARDHVDGAPGGYFVRAWRPGIPNDNVIRASANNLLEPDLGRYSALQTFADINDKGDIAFVALSLDGNFRYLMFQPAGTGPAIPVYTYSNVGSVSRPQLTSDGHILVRLGDNSLVLVDPTNNHFEVVANGFTEMGYAPGMSDDGKVIAFMGNRGNGRGIFVAYLTDSGYKFAPVAGDGENGWTNDSFDLTDAVRVNNTLVSQHGVTVAFEATHPATDRGIYSVRASFFGNNAAADFLASNPVSMSASGATPVLTVLDQYQGFQVTDVELWNGVDDVGRGEIVFWAQTGAGREAIIRAKSTPVIWLDFDPQTGGASAADTIQNQLLLKDVGVKASGWAADFSQSLIAAGLSQSTDFDQLQSAIVDQVQNYFTAAHVNVRVLGKSTDSQPTFIYLSTADSMPKNGAVTTDHGALMTIQIGGAPTSSDPRLLGEASGPFLLPSGQTSVDYYNQTIDDLAVVFADHILLEIGAGSSLGSIATAIASTIAHEAGHNFGLVHLNTNSNQDLMNARVESPGELTSASQGFRDVAVFTDQFPAVTEDSVKRLRFATGASTAGSPPANAFLTSNKTSLYSIAANFASPVTVQSAVVGIFIDDDTMPTYFALGGGNLSDVLATARLPVQAGDKWILLASTDGTTLDIVGTTPGQEAVLANLDISQLGLSTTSALAATVGSSPALNVVQLTDQGPVVLGSATIQGVAAATVQIDGNSIESGASLGIGVVVPGSGPIVKTVTILNSGSGNLILGTVTVAGAGFTVSQPALTTLAPGASTSVTVTLSDGTSGSTLTGMLTIPDNDPNGNFTLSLLASVNNNPRVLGVTRIDGGVGTVKIQIDFSGQLQAGPAGIASNFAIAGDNGTNLIPVTAVYTTPGGKGRVVLTTSTNATDLPDGNYTVRFDGTKVVALNGAPLATSQSQLI
ncbi:MAG: Hemolysin-type calcium-binding region, partial [Planctomycetaceae bacterium]|nr:Hemolysin-type calcium-binding region [Planctomycetaceae bacterium]